MLKLLLVNMVRMQNLVKQWQPHPTLRLTRWARVDVVRIQIN